MLDDILARLDQLLQRVLTLDFLLQLGLLLLVLLVALALRGFARRQMERLQERLRRQGLVMAQLPWTLDLLVALSAAIFPLTAWALGSVAAGALRANARPTDLLAWLVPVFGLWALYRFVATILELNLSETRARLWTRQILRPVVLVLIFLQLTGLLDNILELRLSSSADLRLTLESVLLGLLILVLFMFLNRVTRRLLSETILPRAGVDAAVNQVVTTFTGYAIVVGGLVLALTVMGVNLTALTVIIGGLSVGLGFGLQELINNFVSGFILLTERSLAPGDVIEVDDNIGQVQKIGLRTMTITTPDDVELIIPNGYLLGSTVKSYTHRSPEMRVHVAVSAAVGSPITSPFAFASCALIIPIRMSFTLSIDDFVITFFTAGAGASTLPLQIYSMIKVAVSPEVNAVSTLLMALTLTLVIVASRFAPDVLKAKA